MVGAEECRDKRAGGIARSVTRVTRRGSRRVRAATLVRRLGGKLNSNKARRKAREKSGSPAVYEGTMALEGVVPADTDRG